MLSATASKETRTSSGDKLNRNQSSTGQSNSLNSKVLSRVGSARGDQHSKNESRDATSAASFFIQNFDSKKSNININNENDCFIGRKGKVEGDECVVEPVKESLFEKYEYCSPSLVDCHNTSNTNSSINSTLLETKDSVNNRPATFKEAFKLPSDLSKISNDTGCEPDYYLQDEDLNKYDNLASISDNERNLTCQNDMNDHNLASISDNDRNLIVNYLPHDYTEVELAQLFSRCGQVESCKLVRSKYNRQSLGYAFVKFMTSESAKEAVRQLNGHLINKKYIKVSFARPSRPEIKDANLYVGGLPSECCEDQLKTLFSPYGQIISCRVITPTEKTANYHFGFVRFDTNQQAQTAMEALHGKVPPQQIFPGVFGPITVKFARTPSSAATANPISNLGNVLASQNALSLLAGFGNLNPLQLLAAANNDDILTQLSQLSLNTSTNSQRANNDDLFGQISTNNSTNSHRVNNYDLFGQISSNNSTSTSSTHRVDINNSTGHSQAAFTPTRPAGHILPPMKPISSIENSINDLLLNSGTTPSLNSGGNKKFSNSTTCGRLHDNFCASIQNHLINHQNISNSSENLGVDPNPDSLNSGNSTIDKSSNSSNEPSTKTSVSLVLYNLPLSFTELSVYRLCNKFGSINDVKVFIEDSMCFAIVTMANRTDADYAAKTLSGLILEQFTPISAAVI